MPPINAAWASGIRILDRLRPVRCAMLTATGMKIATTAVELMRLLSTADPIISSTRIRASLSPASRVTQPPMV